MLKGALIAGLSVDQFYNMTLREVYLLFEARREERDARMWETAWQTSILLQPHVKNGSDITPAKLLGKPEPRQFDDERTMVDLSPIVGKVSADEVHRRRDQAISQIVAARRARESKEKRRQYLGGKSIPTKAFEW